MRALAAQFTGISNHLLDYIVAQQDINMYWYYLNSTFQPEGGL
jgi:hypothetical protein